MSLPVHAPVIVYTKVADPYSVRACTLLRMKEVAYVEKQLPACREELLAVSGSERVPVILVGSRLIRGFEELGALELRGELDPLIEDASRSDSSRPQHLSKQTK